jgi:hypothetical protein
MTQTSAGVAVLLAVGCLALGAGVVAGVPGGPSESLETAKAPADTAPVQQTSGGSVSGSPDISVLLLRANCLSRR